MKLNLPVMLHLRCAAVAFSMCVIGQATAETIEPGSYARTVAPFLAQHCTKCHGSEKQEADLALHQINGDLQGGPDAEAWQAVLERLQSGEMPPKDEPRPDAKQLDAVVQWIRGELDAAGKLVHRPSLPSDGNRIEHDLLFHPGTNVAAQNPPRLWRLSPHIYDQLAHELTKNRIKLAQPFSLGPGHGIKDYASAFTVDEPTTAQLIRNANAIVHYLTNHEIKDGKVEKIGFVTREFLTLFDPARHPSDEEIDTAIDKMFDLVLRRKPTSEESRRFATLMKENINEAGRETGVRSALAAVLLMPEVVFRMELGRGEVDEQGRVLLAPRELAFALSFALTDARPDGQLLKAAEEGSLAGPHEVQAQVERILNDPKIKKPRLLRFFREYFGYDLAVDVFKDKKEFEEHEPRILVEDTDQLIEHILSQDKNVFYELLTTNKTFVNHRPDKKGAKPSNEKKRVQLSYNLDRNWKWTAQQPLTLPADQRAGILTQPSWLVAHSLNTENHAILRGKWVRERLLGGTVPDLPITVDAQLPEDPDKTLRERMHVTREKYCWNCHQQMNPLGLPFEMFDHFGRYRDEELGRPVDASGLIDGSGDEKLDGEITNGIEMIKKLAASERVQQVFVRHAFRYFMGRNETPGDAATLVAANRAYNESGGSFNALIVSLLTSDSFLYRTPLESNQARE